jgi:hypothetical protein
VNLQNTCPNEPREQSGCRSCQGWRMDGALTERSISQKGAATRIPNGVPARMQAQAFPQKFRSR